MNSIEIEYRGHVIRYSENADEWTCYDLNSYSSPKLSNVKQRIDKMYLDQRRKSALPCYILEGGYDIHGPLRKIEASIIEYVGPEHRRDHSRGMTADVVDHKVATTAVRHGNERASRTVSELSGLMADTPEALAAFDQAVALYKKARAAWDAYREAVKQIPRVSLDDIPDLVRIASNQEES
jgi:hypothetical protein